MQHHISRALGSRARVLFIDTLCPAPYDSNSAGSRALGGTAATVVRVASALAQHRPVTVAQGARWWSERMAGVDYVPYEHKCPDEDSLAKVASVAAVVVVGAHKLLPRLRRRYPSTPLFLWLRRFPGHKLKSLARVAVDTDTTVLAVSDAHMHALRRFLSERDRLLGPAVRLARIYDPVEDSLAPGDARVDPDKLVCVNPGYQGLSEIIEAFARVRQRIPSLRLHIASPDHLHAPGQPAWMPGAGGVAYRRVIAHLRGALCLFWPQLTLSDPSGSLIATANAVGTPALCHGAGTAPEVVSCPAQELIDARDTDALADRLARWRAGERPRVHGRPELRTAAVCRAWDDLLPRSLPATGQRFSERVAERAAEEVKAAV